MNLSVVGAGHVGLVTGACFAQMGHRVICVDNDAKRIARLKRNVMPYYEPGLEALVRKHAKSGRLRFSARLVDGVRFGEVIFIAVGTPPKANGEADLTYVEGVCRDIARAMTSYRIIVEKSTVPVETGKWLRRTIAMNLKTKVPFDVASNPEFLREGTGVHDFLNPDRIVIGVESDAARKKLLQVYQPLKAPTVVTDIASAELIKHASNSFLAAKISFINAVAQVCDRVGADVEKVAEGMGLDRRIGKFFLDAGIGFGGFCLPKDIEAFIHIADKLGVDFRLLKEVARINEEQRAILVKKIEERLWNLKQKTIAVWGLSFKPHTDDMRLAPSIDVIGRLSAAGAKVRAYDPEAMGEARRCLNGTVFCSDPYRAAKGSDCLVLLTEWPQFQKVDWKKVHRMMEHPIVVDGRNFLDAAVVRRHGFEYVGMGQGRP
ncbi:MAG: UDP-glucose/GDP-mannose dehydrogenase family protein [Candidatus Omnitrophica bacterium]|nr:UDP-glucose/GDP-mannose dehydrogenase family protein [Candidatus Omnitrophota bacterium]